MTCNKPELLAPAGSYECVPAAFSAGADAVYLGLMKYGARAYAGNLSFEELKKALDLAHINGRKIYLTVNTVFKDHEIDDLYELLNGPYENGLDGVIVQDLGVISYILKAFPLLPVHASTQAAVTGTEGVRFLQDLGVKRVVLARELSLKEIKEIKKETGAELECFIHGSMCYSYSGKCLMSSLLGKRSGNRGRCAQPCRLPYDSSYPLSLKDMCMIDHIPELTDAGISSFKIEGRMKSSDYVYAVTSVYRKYIDIMASQEKYAVDPSDRKELLMRYTRGGNCTGYYFSHNGKNMITDDTPAYNNASGPGADTSAYDLFTGVDMECIIRKGQEVIFEVKGRDGSVKINTGVVPEEAKNRPVTADTVKKQLKKTGGTFFKAENVTVTVDDGLFIGNDRLNLIRRGGLNAFSDELLKRYIRDAGIKTDRSRACSFIPDEKVPPAVNVSVTDTRQLAAALKTKADAVTVPTYILNDIPDDVGNKTIYVKLPFVIRRGQYMNDPGKIRDVIRRCMDDDRIKGFYASDLESLRILKELSCKKDITASIHLYALNREAVKVLKNAGVTNTVVPVELNVHELMNRGIKNEELIVYGRLPMMITANCVCNTLKGCRKNNSGHSLYLTDRMGEKLFVHCICSECTNVIYNSIRLLLADETGLFDSIRPSKLIFSFTDEDEETLLSVMDDYYAARDENGSTGVKLIDKFTRGHIKRGVD